MHWRTQGPLRETLRRRECQLTNQRVIARYEAIPDLQSQSAKHRDCFVPRNDGTGNNAKIFIVLTI